MEQKLLIYNTLTRTKERFTPLHAPNVGMYVCRQEEAAEIE